MEDRPPIIGFYTTRHVKASSAEAASEKVKDVVLSDWRSGVYAQANHGNLPELTIKSVDKIRFIDALRSPNAGYTFYSPDS
jgi:hypothetical protein